jgi:RNA polymerase sigma factor (sigma-70 family)
MYANEQFGLRAGPGTARARSEDRRGPVSPDDTERTFTEFVRSHSTKLYAIAYRRCGNRQLADDILQTAFVRVWKAWPNLMHGMDQDAVPLGYVHTAIRNLVVDHHRAAERRPESPWEDERDGRSPAACDVAEEAVFRAMGHELWAAVATLEDIQQGLIDLIYVGQLSTAAAGRALGLAETTARRYHDAALSRLREMIGYNQEEDQV